MDFADDALADGQPFRVLTLVDQWSRQSPAEGATRMSAAPVGLRLNPPYCLFALADPEA